MIDATPDAIGKAVALLRPGADFGMRGTEIIWNDSSQTRPSEAEIAVALSWASTLDVSNERDRRIALGATVIIENSTFVVQTRDDRDFRNINGLASKGIVMTMMGDITSTVSFRDAHNTAHDLTAAGLISMADQVAAHVSRIYARSWELKSMNPIPSNFTDDSYWI